VLQRVKEARVEVEGRIAGAIGPGLLALLGISRDDTRADAEYILDKTLSLRIFPDDEGKMNRSLLDRDGQLLVVSQFTLYADVRKGRRPGFDRAAGPEQARLLYEYFVDSARQRRVRVETGVFQAMMSVYLVNDGPVTILCDSERTL